MATISRNWSDDTIGSLPAGFNADSNNAVYVAVAATVVSPDSPNSLHIEPDGSSRNLVSTTNDVTEGNFTLTQDLILDGSPIVQIIFRADRSDPANPKSYALSLYPKDDGSLNLSRNGGGSFATVEVKDAAGGGLFIPRQVRLTVMIVASGPNFTIKLQRRDDNTYATPQGTWQATPVNAIVASDTAGALTGAGLYGYNWFVPTGTALQFGDLTLSPPVTVTSVSVAPATATIQGGTTQQYAATVAGSNGPSQSVTWAVTGSTMPGMISSSGLYTAPSSTTNQQTLTITATSVDDPSKSGSTTVTIPAAANSSDTAGAVTYSQVMALFQSYSANTASLFAAQQTAILGAITGLFPADRLAAIDKLKGTLDANIVSIVGSVPAAQALHDDELATSIPTATTTALANAIVAKLPAPAPIDTTTLATAIAAKLPTSGGGGLSPSDEATIASIKATLDGLTVKRSDGSIVLAPLALDGISTTDTARGESPNFRQELNQLHNRFFNRIASNGSTITTYGDDSETVLVVQPLVLSPSGDYQGPPQ